MKTDCDGNLLPEGTHEYAFDVKLFAVVRVAATSEAVARAAMENIIDAIEPTTEWLAGYNSVAPRLKVTEVSLAADGEYDNSKPFEIDGEPTEK